MKIEHIALYVKDLERAREFFEKYFSASAGEKYHNKNTGFTSYFLTFDDGSRLEIMNKKDVKELDNSLEHTGLTHLAFSVESKDLVDSLTRRLEKDGYKVLSGPRTTGDGYYESCIEGIEGNRIEITI